MAHMSAPVSNSPASSAPASKPPASKPQASKPRRDAQRRPPKSITVGVLVGLAVLVCGLVFAAWWFHTFERVVKVQHLPPRGEAAYNPLYALKLALNKDGRKTVARQRLDLDDNPLGANDTLLLLSDPRYLTSKERDALMAWVEKGGHLILRMPPPGEKIEADEASIFKNIGIAPDTADNDENAERPDNCMGLRVPGEEDHREFCYGRRFYFLEDGPDILVSWDDEARENSVFARLAHGRGTVDVLADLDFLTNEQFEELTHYALALQLFEPNRRDGGTAHLVYSADVPSLLRLLLRHGWMAIWPLALALVLWLWLRTERFGPLFPSPAVERRSLLEHIQANGDHLYRYGRSATLYDEVLQAFMRRLRRRDPYAAALEGPVRVEAIARRTGLSVNEVEDALRYPRPNDSRDFVLRIAKLLQLRRRL
jgi:hypothetical protein